VKNNARDTLKIESYTTPPKNQEAEDAIIGALLLESDAFIKIADTLKADYFYNEKHKIIFQAIAELYQEQKPIDLITVVSKLRQQGNLSTIGGAGFLAQLTNNVGSSANLPFYSILIIQEAIRRNVIDYGAKAQSDAYGGEDIFQLIQEMETFAYSLRDKANINQTIDWQKFSQEAINSILLNRLEELETISTGIKDFPIGFGKGNLIIIGGRPGMGKTTLALQFCINLLQRNIPCAFFSFEMSQVEIFMRMLQNLTKISTTDLKNPNDSLKFEIADKGSLIQTYPLFLNDSSRLTVADIRSKILKMKMDNPAIAVIFIDYLGLITNTHAKADLRINVEYNSNELKRIAKELKVTIVCLSQLNREVEKRTSKKPTLSDLRESGSIEQDADIVMFTYRPYYYFEQFNDSKYSVIEGTDISSENHIEIIIAKNRNGSTKTVDLCCDMKTFSIFAPETNQKSYYDELG
jgi:replicative DNA helicase